jgi:NADH:ubiquinone oxidoreductase subunit F (NADH-binding)/ferredoxin
MTAMTLPPLPETLCIGQARLTAGLDRMDQVDLAAYHSIFGKLPRLTAEELISITERVDLRGRGGAAFPVARKLRATQSSVKARRRPPVIVVNATEGEPGSYKDKMLLRKSPYLVLGGALVAAWALKAREIIIGVSGDGTLARWVTALTNAEPDLKKMVVVVQVPERFVSGEGSALVNAVNGRIPLPSGKKVRASESGVDNRPTLLSNAETFAQIAVLALLGPTNYATVGTPEEPGTVLLSVSGSVRRPAVVEVPAGLPLGEVLDLCGATPEDGVLVGGYHGMWLPAEAAYDVPVSRAGMAGAGATLGAGIILPVGSGTCAIGEMSRVVSYLAGESSGQCGPCKLGLPSLARSLAAVADGSGGLDALDTARRTAASVRGRGACSHPDGVFRFVMSALDVLTEDLTAHLFRGSCGRPVRGVLPMPPEHAASRLAIDWTRCRGHGLCAHLVPELVQLDRQGYPVPLDMPVPPWLEREARQAVDMCPALALRLATPEPPAARPAARDDDRRLIAETRTDLIVSESWIAELSDAPARSPRDRAPRQLG